MMPAAKHFDPVLGIDIHIVQPPGPVPPVPIPHPFVGFLIDPFDYVPIVGATVMVNGLPRAQAGTAGKAVPVHIPIGGMFVKPPANECEMFMGSATVEVDGDAFSFLSLPALSCQDIGMPPPPRINPKKKSKVKSLVLPTSVVLPIPAGPPVLVGGPPTISLMAMGMKVGMGALGKGLKRLAKTKALRKLKSKLKRSKKAKAQNAKCDRPGHPIDPVTGATANEFLDCQSFDGFPFLWERTYNSARQDNGPLGYGFRHNYQRELKLLPAQAIFIDEEGREFLFDYEPTEGYYDADRGYCCVQIDRYNYVVSRPDCGSMHFHRESGQSVARFVRQVHDGTDSQLEYDERGQLTRIVQRRRQPAPRVELVATLLVYDRVGHITEVRRGPVGGESYLLATYEYSAAGCLVRWGDALGGSGAYDYDEHRRMTRETDRNGFWFSYIYDEHGRCVESKGQDGLWKVNLAYEPGCTIVTESDGGEWQFLYDELGTVTQVIDPYGGILERVTDEAGLVIAEIDSGGRQMDWLYDADGHHIGRLDRWGNVLPSKDQLPNPPNPLDHVLPDNNKDRQWGPQLAQLPSMDIAMPSQIVDLARDILPVAPKCDPSIIRDALGRMVKRVDELGYADEFAYDPAGNMISHTDPDGRQSRHVTSSWNLHGSETDPLGHTVRYEYTQHEKVSRIVDANGNVSAYTYDHRDRITSITRHGVLRETYKYDVGDRLIEKRDGAGNLLLSFEISENGLPSKRKLASGEEHTYQYDALGNFTEASTKDCKVELQYDRLGQLTSDQRRGVGVRHRYMGLILGESRHFERFTSTYGVERDGTLQIRTPDGSVHRIRQNADGSVYRALGNGTYELSRYDARGRCRGRIVWRGEGAGRDIWHVRYEYSGTDELRQVHDRLRGLTLYQYDAAHRVVTQRPANRPEYHLTYDADGNLVSVGAHRHITYREGNRLQDTDDETFEYNHRNHLAIRRRRNGSETRYVYNSLDMLVGVEWSERDQVWSAGYDGLGRRWYKRYGEARTDFFWDGDRLAAEQSSNGRLRIYIYPSAGALLPFMFLDYDTIDSASDTGRAYHVFHNQVGVPERIEDATGTIVWQAEHIEPYGWITVAPGNRVDYHLRFPGHYFDVESGLHYNRFRYYDPALGRYLQSDPSGQSGGINLYAYAPNPLVQVDVLGLAHDKKKTGSENTNASKAGLSQEVLAEKRYLTRGEQLVEDSKPSMRGKLGEHHTYANPGHHDVKSPNYAANRSVLPDNHVELFNNSVPHVNPSNGKVTYYAKDADGNIHRFQGDGNRQYHWNGQTNGTTKSGEPRSIPVTKEIEEIVGGAG